MSSELWKAYAHGMSAAMQEGGLYVSSLLLRSSGKLGLTDSEAMLLLQIMAFKECEYNEFPTPEQLADRMGETSVAVEEHLRRLIRDGFLSIDDYIDSVTGIQSERYNWNGWLLKAAEWSAEQKREAKKLDRELPQPHKQSAAAHERDLFTVFEQEFGRLLSPIECETIAGWLDQDRYTEEIIRFALKEAVFAGKLSLRYIDRILIEWSRNRVTNAEEARAHSQKFRNARG